MLLKFFLLSLANASISFTISESKLFKPFREKINSINEGLGTLFRCGYCIGHWTAFFLVIIYRPIIFNSKIILLDYFITSIALAWISGIQWILMCLLVNRAEK